MLGLQLQLTQCNNSRSAITHPIAWETRRRKPWTAHHLEGEPHPGGAWRLCLRPDDGGKDLWQGGVYREVVAPERLVFTFPGRGRARMVAPAPKPWSR
jgi:hypothetical protein